MTSASLVGRLYPWILAAHIVLAAIWFGGLLVLQVLVLRARAGDPEYRRAIVAATRDLRVRVIQPSAGFLLAAGAALTVVGEWGYRTPWILIGVAGFAASFAVSSLATRASDERALDLTRVELAILAVVVLDMALKPG